MQKTMDTAHPLTEKVLEREGCPIHYWTGGASSAPWVVLLHGAGEDHRAMEPQIQVLAARYRVLCPDLRGHGRSRPMGPFRVSIVVEDLLAIMDREKIGRAAYVGQSMGGNIAQEIAYRHPDRVACLALTACFCNTKRYTPVRSTVMKWTAPLLPLYPWRLSVALTATVSAVDPQVQSYLVETAAAMGKRDYNAVLGATFTCPHPEKGYRIGKPILLLYGEKDFGMLRRIGKRWAQEEPDCAFHSIPHAAHCANQDNPAAFNALLTDFLERRYPPRL